jgi:Ca-activated chloride channel family protein
MGGRLQRGRKLDGKQRQRLLLAVILPIVIIVVTFAAQDTGPANSTVASFKVDVGLVNLNVTVNDTTGRPYTALKAENFRVYDNGTEQAIHHFSSDDVPFTMGLVLDRSGSMFMMMKEVYQAAFHTILNSKAEDEFFITTFNEQSGIQQDFNTDRQVLEQQLKQVQAGGATALYDAILGALDHIQEARHDKKALLVVTDGNDNSSTHRFQEVLERARQESVALYVVGMFDKNDLFAEGTDENHLKKLLTELAEATGGRAYFPKTVKQCEQDCIAIAQELRRQYAVGYYPSQQARDGSWHNVQVKLQLPKDVDELGLVIRTRAGYYAPTK